MHPDIPIRVRMEWQYGGAYPHTTMEKSNKAVFLKMR